MRAAKSKNAVLIEVKVAVNSLEHPRVIVMCSAGLLAHVLFVTFKRGKHCDVKRRAWIRSIDKRKLMFVTPAAIIDAELKYDNLAACCFVLIRREE